MTHKTCSATQFTNRKANKKSKNRNFFGWWGGGSLTRKLFLLEIRRTQWINFLLTLVLSQLRPMKWQLLRASSRSLFNLAEYICLSPRLAYVLFWVTRWHAAMSKGRRWCYVESTMGGARESKEFNGRTAPLSSLFSELYFDPFKTSEIY